jgi:hypothetical protein
MVINKKPGWYSSKSLVGDEQPLLVYQSSQDRNLYQLSGQTKFFTLFQMKKDKAYHIQRTSDYKA